MTDERGELASFHKALVEVQQKRQRELSENPEREQARLKTIDFRRAIELHLLPIVEEYLTVLGKLWFGYERRLSGPMLRKELITIPSYIVAHEFYASLAVFWVAEISWKERDVPFVISEEQTEFRSELFQQGYRCRITFQDDGLSRFESDGLNTQIIIEDYAAVDRGTLYAAFAEAFVKGPFVIHYRWKNWF